MSKCNLVRLNGAKLNRLRLQRGLYRGELAKRAGVCANTVTAALAGRPVSLGVARKLAQALDVELDRVLRLSIPRKAECAAA